jgi:hypothetical protein
MKFTVQPVNVSLPLSDRTKLVAFRAFYQATENDPVGNVSDKAVWSSSNPGTLIFTRTEYSNELGHYARFVAVNPGAATVTVHGNGMTAKAEFQLQPAPGPVPPPPGVLPLWSGFGLAGLALAFGLIGAFRR